MLTWIRTRLTFSNITASLALVFALGGTATAAVLITGDDIASNTITARNLAKSAVTGKKIKKGTVTKRALSHELRSGLGSPGSPGPAGPIGASGPGGKGFPVESTSGGPFMNYVSQTLVIPLTVTSQGVYIIHVNVNVTNTDAVQHNAFCGALDTSDPTTPVAGGYGPGPVDPGQTLAGDFANVVDLAPGVELAVGWQTDGPFDLDTVQLNLIRLIEG